MQVLHGLKIALFITCMGALSVQASHGIAMHGIPKYPNNFTAFEYVNPKAPKRGTLSQGAIGMFDTFNPFGIMGIPPAGIDLTHDTLMKQSLDEPFSLYGLIADDIIVPENRAYVIFHINPKAKFSDGSSITAEDVVFSFKTLRDKGSPTYRYYYRDVAKIETPDNLTVKFIFGTDSENRELPLILGELPILAKSYWQNKDFSKTSLEVPVSSGPYIVESFEPGKYITYKLNPNYWAKDLNVNKGFYNFEKIKFDYYRDATVLSEAFKAGAIDIRQENEAKKWAAFKQDTAVLSGKLKMAEFHHQMPSGMQGFVFNTRREIFQNPKVREALAYAFDFEWANNNLFHGLYKRTSSYFDNSELRATGTPNNAELVLLEPFKDELDARVFTTSYTPPNPTQATMKQSLKTALDLLAEAGWQVQNGVLKNAKGQPFKFEILLDATSAPTWERVVLPFVGQLKKLGIQAQISTVDIIQYKNRLDNFDYDMIVTVWGQSLSPGNEQRYFWGSTAADTPASLNYSGVESNAIDSLIESIISAKTKTELQDSVHALDRVLLWSHLVIPHWHTPVLRYLYWDKFGIPKNTPLKGISSMTWWMK